MVRQLAPALLAQFLATPPVALAQDAFHLQPSATLTHVHDSNLLASSTAPLRDFITRLSPAIDSRYRSPLLTLDSRYTLDIEQFAQHSALSSAAARQQATFTLGYEPARRVGFSLGGEFLTTNTPGELNAASGLAFTRARAQRLSAHSGVTRAFSRVTSGTLDVSFTEDRLGDRFVARTHEAAVGAERRLSARNGITAGYRWRAFASIVDGGFSDVDAHAVTLGWSHEWTRSVSVVLEAGPRVTGGRLAPEWSAGLDADFKAADLVLSYARTQTTVLGVAGAADIQQVTASAAWAPVRWLDVHVAPAVFRSSLSGRRADVYTMRIGIGHPIGRRLSIELAADASVQRGQLVAIAGGHTIARHSVALRLVAAPVNRPE